MRKPNPNPSSSSSSRTHHRHHHHQEGIGTGTSSSSPNKTTKVGLKRGPWTPEEDQLLASYIKREGEGRWRTLPQKAGLLRCGKSCRLRWMNYLRPSVKRGQIAPDEEDLILRLHRLLGNRWSLIAGRIPGRTDNEIKNYWNTHLSKKLISQGIDPRTHKPLEPNFSNGNEFSFSRVGNHISAPNDASYVPFVFEDLENHDPPIGGIQPDHHFRSADADADGHGNMEFRSSHEGGISNEDEDDINYCTEDAFSSFLNSLINEDVFSSQNLLHQQQVNVIVPNSDPLISSTQAFTFGPGWDAPINMASISALDQNDPKRLIEHVEKSSYERKHKFDAAWS